MPSSQPIAILTAIVGSPERKRILVARLGVELLLRSRLLDHLGKMGHEVAIINSLDGEIKRLIDQGLDFTVALIDVDVFGKNREEEVANEIREKFPEVKIISLSQELPEWADMNIDPSLDNRTIEGKIREL